MGHVSNIMPPKEQQRANGNVSAQVFLLREYMSFSFLSLIYKLLFVYHFRKKTVVLISSCAFSN